MTDVAKKIAAYRSDFPLFAREVLKIQTKGAKLTRFRFNRAQQRVWELIKEDMDAGKPVRMFILKARQLGFSTLIQGLMYWLVSLRRNRNVLVAAHEDDAAAQLFQKAQVFYKTSPEDFRPMLRLSNRKELHFANPDPKAPKEQMGLESRITVKTAKNRNLGASMTLQGLHLSEFAKYERVLDDVKTTMATVLQTVPRLPETFVFLETTADGMGYAADFWKARNGYRKVFVSWCADDEYTVPGDTLYLTLDLLGDVDESEFGNEVWVRDRVLDELRFWYPEHADDQAWLEVEALCRLQWRRSMISDQFQGEQGIELFRQEYPITPEEAFLTTGSAVFDQRKLQDRLAALERKDEDGRVVGLIFEPTGFRFDKRVSDFYHAKHGPLRVYKVPDPKKRYVIGADVSEGLPGGDMSAAQVLELPDLEQVAVYEDRLDPDDFADVLYHLGRIYGWAPLMVETNGPGFATVLRLGKDLYYPAMYRREVFDKTSKSYQKKFGWHTNRQTKNVLVTGLRVAVRDDLILFRDMRTLRDMTFFVKHNDDSMGAVTGEHDDTVMALGLAYQMAVNQGVEHMRRSPDEQPADDAGPPPEGSFEWWARLGIVETNRHRAEQHYRERYGVM